MHAHFLEDNSVDGHEYALINKMLEQYFKLRIDFEAVLKNDVSKKRNN